MIAVGSISIFIGTIAPNKGFVNFSSTVIGLAIAFSSGVFLSPELIWEPLRKIAYFAPTIWHVELNYAIANTANVSWQNSETVSHSAFNGFGLSFFSLAYRRRKQFQGLS